MVKNNAKDQDLTKVRSIYSISLTKVLHFSVA